jgi:hypothetical protein
MNSATGAITVSSVGRESAVTARKTNSVWPLPVSRSSWRSAWVIQITAVSPRRQARKALPAILRM